MIIETITFLKERTRSSHYSIAGYIGNKYQSQLPANFNNSSAENYCEIWKAYQGPKLFQTFGRVEEVSEAQGYQAYEAKIPSQ